MYQRHDSTDMSRSDANKILEELKFASQDLGFIITNASYDIFDWIWNSEVLNKKGIYVYGIPGVGKTFTFQAIRRWEIYKRKPYPMMNININTMEDLYRIEGSEYIQNIVQYPRVAFHNFGFQNDELSDYGSKRSLFLDVIDQRYDIYQLGKQNRTFITSNFKQNEVVKYGMAFARRVSEMMNYFEIK